MLWVLSYYCARITLITTTKYFYIYKREANDKCTFIDKCPHKVIANYFECVEQCNNNYYISLELSVVGAGPGFAFINANPATSNKTVIGDF